MGYTFTPPAVRAAGAEQVQLLEIKAAAEGNLMAKTSRKTRALAARDSALVIVKRIGVWETIGPAKILMARVGGLQIGYCTLSGLRTLPYGLDVWTPSKKVLNMEWDSQDNIVITSLHPAPWEAQLETLATAIQHSKLTQRQATCLTVALRS
jgi:hypothetical protein